MISTYPPTQCGIATFADSLSRALVQHGASVDIVDLPTASGGPPHDAVLHRHQGLANVSITASLLNSFDVVILQHEFGIWDGDHGRGVVDLLSEIAVPVITVLHTVPGIPRGGERRVLQRLLDISDAIVTLSHSSHRRLTRDYVVRPRSTQMIPHGADVRWPNRDPQDSATGRLLTWGLLGQGKGVEWGIKALAILERRGLQAEYIVAGATHPNVVRTDGERYRRSLTETATRLGVADRLTLVDGYLSPTRLQGLMNTASAFLLPYDSQDQITSGVLVEALAAGGPVVATRFPHAVELLGTGAGLLVDHQDPVAIANAVETLVKDPHACQEMRRRSELVSEAFAWDRIGEEYLVLANRLWRGSEVRTDWRRLQAEVPA